MFNKTRRQLTLLNSVVFLLILVMFGGTLYAYVAIQLFDKVDDSMLKRAESFRLADGRPARSMYPRAYFDPRVFVLLRDVDGSIVNLYPSPIEELDDVKVFLSRVEQGSLRNGPIQTQKVDDHYYRILRLPYLGADNRLIRSDFTENRIREVIAVSIVDSEVSLLSHLLQVIITGLVVSMLAVLSAGYYLARRALVPIKEGWDKQNQFVADASHELRTPLAVIKSNAELLLRHPERTIEMEGFRITNVVRESMRMSKLVSTLLTLARADANQTEINLGTVVVDEVICSIAEQFKPLIEMKGIHLAVNLADHIEITADKERLQQLIVILLDNAIKYTPEAGTITLSCQRQANWAVIVVADTGEGIAAADLPRIFDRFYRGDKVRSREQGGTGLGLSIAKWIVEKHGGRIKVDSEIGVGTKFQFSLPLNKPR